MSFIRSHACKLPYAMSVLAIPIVVILGLLSNVSQAVGATYYVSTGGNDSSAGSAGAPWKTLGKAAKAMVAGDTAIVMNGTYVEKEVQFLTSGTASKPITLQAQNKHQAVLSSISSCNPNISLYGSYVVIDGLSLVINPSNVYCAPNSASGTGVRCWNGGAGCIVRNIKTDDPTGPSGKIRSHGIKTNQHNSILEDNELAAGLETLGGDNVIVRRNRITCCGGAWGHSIITKGGGRNVQVYQNIIDAPTQNGWGILLGGSNASDSPQQECFNCIAFNNVIRVSANFRTMGFQGCKDCTFFNNVAFGGAMGMNTAPTSSNINNTWKNNILDCQGSNATESLQNTYTIDYNLFYNCTGVPQQAHPVTGNPLFVNSSSDWHLSPGSPAIRAGTTISPRGYSGEILVSNFDWDGKQRTDPWDLGIYTTSGQTADLSPPAAPTNLRLQ